MVSTDQRDISKERHKDETIPRSIKMLLIYLMIPFCCAIYPIYTLSVMLVSVTYELTIKLIAKFDTTTSPEVKDEQCKLKAKKMLLRLLRLWYNWDVQGVDQLKTLQKPILFIMYHAVIPLDMMFITTWLKERADINSKVVGHHTFFTAPIFKNIGWMCNLIRGPMPECIETLESGVSVVIAPGGAEEGFLDDNNYRLEWGKRIGFAKLAIRTGVPIVPFFCENIRESNWIFSPFYSLMCFCYFKFRHIGFAQVCTIGLPVKMTIWLGEPIIFDPKTITPEELAAQTKDAVKELIRKHQRVPGRITDSLYDRFFS